MHWFYNLIVCFYRIDMDPALREKVNKIEDFIDKRLKPDLVRAIAQRWYPIKLIRKDKLLNSFAFRSCKIQLCFFSWTVSDLYQLEFFFSNFLLFIKAFLLSQPGFWNLWALCISYHFYFKIKCMYSRKNIPKSRFRYLTILFNLQGQGLWTTEDIVSYFILIILRL